VERPRFDVTPLRVAIGAIAGVRGGPATYAIELVRALCALAPETPPLELVLLTDQPDAFSGLGVEVAHIPLPSPYRQPWWDNVAVPLALRRLGADVYHGTKHALPLLGLPRRLATVVTVHDLAVYAEPETFSVLQRWQLRVHLRHAAWRADRVICVSRHAAEDVATRLAVTPARLLVIPQGIGARFVPADATSRAAARRAWQVGDSEYLVAFVGTLQPRKRIEVAIDAVGRLRAEGLPVTLAIAGRRRPGYAPAWLAAPPPWVRLLGTLDDEAVVRLYGAADVMASPSTYEGFGLTFLEAMACGCPVVGVRTTSVPEVVGDGGRLVERAEPVLVAGAVGDLLRDSELRAETARRARAQAARFSWAAAAVATRRAYHDAARARGVG
jgi:glycosyltransferase involved in cell wall biosynthesis